MCHPVPCRVRGTPHTTSLSASCHPCPRPVLLPRTVPWLAAELPHPRALPMPAPGRPVLLAHSHGHTRTSTRRHTGATLALCATVPPACLPANLPVPGKN